MKEKNESSQLNILRIDHNNSLCQFNRDSFVTFKDNLYSVLLELDEMDTLYILDYIKKVYFDSSSKNSNISNIYNFDFIKLSLKLCQKAFFKDILINIKSDLIFNSLRHTRLDNFIINEKTVYDITSVLLKSFNSFDKIKSERTFLKALEESGGKKYEMEDLAYSVIDYDSFDPRSTCSSFLSKYNSSNDCNTSFSRRASYYSKLNMDLKNSQNIYIFPKKGFSDSDNHFRKSKNNQNFPEELITLNQILSNYRKVKFVIPNHIKEQNFNFFFLLFILNFSWLFPNLNSIEIDLESDLSKYIHDYEQEEEVEVEELTEETEGKNVIKHKNYNRNGSYKYKYKSLYNTIAENKTRFEMILLIPFFTSLYLKRNCSKRDFSLDINLPETYPIEIDFLFKQEKILINNFHLLDFIDISSNLSSLNLTFNSLDSNTFKRVVSLLHKINNLKNLSLNLFPDNSDEFYDNYQLKKLVNLNSLNFGNSKYKDKVTNFIDENEILLNRLSILFEENLESLVFILNRKVHTLNSLKIIFDIPIMLFIGDNFINVFHKFFLNLLLMVENNFSNTDYRASLAESSIENFEVSSKNFTLNSAKFPFIKEKLKNLTLCQNRRINSFALNLRFYKIIEIENILPYFSEIISLPSLDDLTFEYLLNIFQEKRISYLPNLVRLDLIFSDILFKLSPRSVENIFRFFQLSFPKNLKEINIRFEKLQLEDEIIQNILELIQMNCSHRVETFNLYHIKWKQSNKSRILPKRNSVKTFVYQNLGRKLSMIMCMNKILSTKSEYGEKGKIFRTCLSFLAPSYTFVNFHTL